MFWQLLMPLIDRHLCIDCTATVTASTSEAHDFALSEPLSRCWHSTVTMYAWMSSWLHPDNLQRQRTMNGKSATSSILSPSRTSTLHDTQTKSICVRTTGEIVWKESWWDGKQTRDVIVKKGVEKGDGSLWAQISDERGVAHQPLLVSEN